MRLLMRLLKNESGQAVVMGALSLAVIGGVAALAIDVGQLRYQKRNLQAAADAAALAAGMEIRTCGATPNCAAMQAAAQSALAENGLTGSTLITNCSTPGTGLTVQVNDPPCALGSSDPNHGNNQYTEVVVSQQQQTYFARMLGINAMQISARAEARRNPAAPCVYTLDPTGADAIDLAVGLGIQADCGLVDESNNSTALYCLLGLDISAPQIMVHGGAGGLLCGSTPPPRTYVPLPSPADPLSYIPTPPTAGGSCGTSTGSPYFGSSSQVSLSLVGTAVFNPGVYCGGIAITAALLTNITFNPGVYILKDGPAAGIAGLLGAKSGGLDVTISLVSTITGQGVTFYNEGPTGAFDITLPSTLGLSTFSLSAPTTGNYAGVLFFQPPTVTVPVTVTATLLGSMNLSGAIYAPGASVSYGVNALANPSAYNILVAKDISFLAGVLSSFGNNFSTLSGGSPLNANDAVLVQ